ncbi:MAG: leucine-rich repeat protein [Muribaculaceae bacterium]|nr:leucine-rich repeat protein [Muribaculaceae bacterium]
MKKNSLLLRLLTFVAFLTCVVGVRAATENFSSNGIYYQLRTYSDGSGVLTVENNGSFNTYSGVVNIPDTVYYNGGYYPVTGIGYQAFKGCTGLTAVTIPEGVTMLLNESFAGCTSLTRITLPSTMTAIYNYAFTGCTNLQFITCMRETAESFNSNNFDASTYASAVLMVPQGSLSSYQSTSAWSQFSNMQEQNKFVVDGIYYTITSGTTVSVTYRDTDYCSYDGYVNIPPTVTHNGTTYTVTGIGTSAFRDCVNHWECEIYVPNTVTTIGNYAFYNCHVFYVELGKGVTSIGNYAFQGGTEDYMGILYCRSATPPTITSNTFSEKAYDNVVLWVPRDAIPAYMSATNWSNFRDDYRFGACDFVCDSIPYRITGFDEVEVSAYCMAPDSSRYYTGTGYELEHVNIPLTVEYEGRRYYVTSIGYGACLQWKMTDVTLADNIMDIETYAFYHCPNLTTVNFSHYLKNIGAAAFFGSTALNELYIPNSVETIGNRAFYRCDNLRSLTIGNGLEYVGWQAFYSEYDGGLQSVTCNAPVPPEGYDWAENVDNMFSSVQYQNATLHVPASGYQAYQTAPSWRCFNNIQSFYSLDDALNVPGGTIKFSSEGDYPFVVVEGDGRIYAQSSNQGVHNSESRVTTTVHVTEQSILSFDFKAWGEGVSYDECVFMKNGTSIFRYGARDNDWETYSVELNAGGTYELVWFYHKDVSDNGQGDYFALDNIKVEPKIPRGDVDCDGNVGIGDVSALIDYLLNGASPGVTVTSADTDRDGNVSIGDVSALIDYLLNGVWPNS